MKVRLLSVLIVVGLAFTGATALPPNAQVSSVPGDPLKGSGKVARALLTYGDLFSTVKPATPVNEAAFALSANAAPPAHFLEGRLELISSERNSIFEKLRDDFNYLGTRKDVNWDQLPKFSFDFVQNGSHLIPVRQGLVITGHPAWNYVVGPGRAWQEEGDHGYSRASFPFTLVQRNQNCTHNGVMTFLFTDGKRNNISKIRYQITQETCLYFKFNLWGQVSATYTPYRVKDRKIMASGIVAAKLALRSFPTAQRLRRRR